MTRAARRALLAATVTLTLVGCSTSFWEGKKIDYKSAEAQRTTKLDVPPDLTSPTRDDRYQVPDVSPTGTATFSAYSNERSGAARTANPNDVLPEVKEARVERAGAQRWLVVQMPPERVWPIVKEFWQEAGFLIKSENAEIGVMETDWAENRAKIPDDIVRNILGKVIDGMYSTSERDKFRTRLERGVQPGTTEVYISHRGVVEVYTNQQRDSTVWQPRPSDPELEAEFLRRLMVRFGADEVRAKQQIAEGVKQERARIVTMQDGTGSLELSEPFDRAWRRVGLALDRVGFTVEDRDRAHGYYFVRYVDPEKDALDTEKQGFFSKLFFGKNKGIGSTEQYRVQVKDLKEISEVQVLNKDGAADPSTVARKILALLHDQLK
ncbi:MAG TPA: outer membrane protein assembly factor BamC [Burkholderiales bacterium]|nr:outer membrane protein assembly factor BamC [Burkholderiales bacterium]